jgi:uncharacterized protein with von Willebrand factor type A (vWA) domain
MSRRTTTKSNSSNSKPQLENNLLNITTSDPIYSITASDIYRLLLQKTDDQLKPLLAVPQVLLIATDSYFLHYSVAPMLKKQNPDELMNNALKFQQEYVASDRYQYLRTITMLDDELSKLYTFTLTKSILEKLYEKLQQLSQEQQQEIQNVLQQMQQFVNQIQQQLIQQQPQQGQNQQNQTPDRPAGDVLMPDQQPLLPPDIGSSLSPAPAPQTQPSQQQNILQQLLNNPQIQQLTKKLMEKLGINDNNFKQMLEEASREAEKATKELKEIMRFAGGKHAGKQPGTIEFLADLADAIMHQKVETKVIELAGKIADFMPRFTKTKKVKDKHGDELSGYRLTKRLEEALPKELALPDELFYYKLASSGFVAKEKQTIKEGAFYVLVDKSGSMAGEKTVWARAVALALLKLAREKKRRFFMRFFDYNVYDLLDDADFKKLLTAILTVESDGGTSIDSALKTALQDLKKLAEYTNTIILITDGEDEVTVEPEEFKKVNATLIAVMIQGRNETLQMIAEKTGGKYMKAELTEKGALELVEEVR